MVAPATKRGAFPRPQGGCMIFAAKGGIRNGAEGAHLASAAVLYTSRGRSTQPACKASADHRQNPWRPGPKARRRHQPSRRSRVNLREYWKAPHRSRSRPRYKAPEPSSPSGLVHKACQPSGILESTTQAPIPTAPQELVKQKDPAGAGSFCYLNQLPEGMAAVMIDFLRILC